LSKETERLVKELRKELRVLRSQVKQKRNPKLSKTYQELVATLT